MAESSFSVRLRRNGIGRDPLLDGSASGSLPPLFLNDVISSFSSRYCVVCR